MSATETCYCGAVQLSFSIEGENLVTSFVCNCTDCRKITASMFASNFIIKDTSLKYVRGEDKITRFAQSDTIATGNTMMNYFCSVCGSLMYRLSSGSPRTPVMRIGQVDNLTLHETRLAPKIEQFTKDRVSWFKGAEGAEQHEGNYFAEQRMRQQAAKGRI